MKDHPQRCNHFFTSHGRNGRPDLSKRPLQNLSAGNKFDKFNWCFSAMLILMPIVAAFTFSNAVTDEFLELDRTMLPGFGRDMFFLESYLKDEDGLRHKSAKPIVEDAKYGEYLIWLAGADPVPHGLKAIRRVERPSDPPKPDPIIRIAAWLYKHSSVERKKLAQHQESLKWKRTLILIRAADPKQELESLNWLASYAWSKTKQGERMKENEEVQIWLEKPGCKLQYLGPLWSKLGFCLVHQSMDLCDEI